jgi:hypothetical protein
MVQLLHKYSITAAESSVKLLKVIKNPITDHLPPGERSSFEIIFLRSVNPFHLTVLLAHKHSLLTYLRYLFTCRVVSHGPVRASLSGNILVRDVLGFFVLALDDAQWFCSSSCSQLFERKFSLLAVSLTTSAYQYPTSSGVFTVRESQPKERLCSN